MLLVFLQMSLTYNCSVSFSMNERPCNVNIRKHKFWEPQLTFITAALYVLIFGCIRIPFVLGGMSTHSSSLCIRYLVYGSKKRRPTFLPVFVLSPPRLSRLLGLRQIQITTQTYYFYFVLVSCTTHENLELLLQYLFSLEKTIFLIVYQQNTFINTGLVIKPLECNILKCVTTCFHMQSFLKIAAKKLSLSLCPEAARPYGSYLCPHSDNQFSRGVTFLAGQKVTFFCSAHFYRKDFDDKLYTHKLFVEWIFFPSIYAVHRTENPQSNMI